MFILTLLGYLIREQNTAYTSTKLAQKKQIKNEGLERTLPFTRWYLSSLHLTLFIFALIHLSFAPYW